MGKSGRRRAFTLVELLVVVGIIAILLGMLLPQIAGAREKARRMVCAGQLRGIGGLAIAYATDNNAGLPPWTWGSFWNGWTDTSFQTLVALNPDAVQTIGSTYRITNAKLLYCPSNPSALERNTTSGAWPTVTGSPPLQGSVRVGYQLLTPRLWIQALNGGAHSDGTPAWTGYPVNASDNLYYCDNYSAGIKDLRHPAAGNYPICPVKSTGLNDLAPYQYELATDVTQAWGSTANPTLYPTSFAIGVAADGNQWTNHLGPGGSTDGGNSVFLDGHVEWVNHRDQRMCRQVGFGSSYTWFYW